MVGESKRLATAKDAWNAMGAPRGGVLSSTLYLSLRLSILSPSHSPSLFSSSLPPSALPSTILLPSFLMAVLLLCLTLSACIVRTLLPRRSSSVSRAAIRGSECLNISAAELFFREVKNATFPSCTALKRKPDKLVVRVIRSMV